MKFQQINNDNPIARVIKSAFDTDLPVSGAWGYSVKEATIIETNESNIPIKQLEHMLASMRAYLEMNMTLDPEERYGSINLNELSREAIEENGACFDKVNYEISAMKETVYSEFINEYKERYGKEDFDLQKHFSQRKEETLTRVVTYWFEVSKIV
jgi:hypothetical protein